MKVVWVLRWYTDGEPSKTVPWPYMPTDEQCRKGYPSSLTESRKTAHEYQSIREARASGGDLAQDLRNSSGWVILRRTKKS